MELGFVLARFLYTLLYALLLPAFILRLWLRGRLNPGYRRRVRERFGIIPHRPTPGGLWVHAVSVGETLAAEPFIRRFQQRYPDVSVIVTTTTPTGSEQVKRLFGESVFHMFLPYDLPPFWQRFLNTLRPGLLVVMETELWPNLMAACEQRHLPVILANARLSEKSAQGYAKFSAITEPMLQRLTLVAAQHAADGQRFLDLGLPESKLEVTGSVKFDVSIAPNTLALGQTLRGEWGNQRRVLALASSHAGEDELLLDIFPALQAQCPDLLLLLIPRHPERFEAVANAAHSRRLTMQRRSRGKASASTQVYVADSMGEMLTLLASADLVLMGKTLIEQGGHNPIEPAALGKATLVGPHYSNFNAIVDNLVDADACQVVSNEPGKLTAQLLLWLEDGEQRQRMGQAAQQVVEQNKGTVARLVELAGKALQR